MSAKKKAVEFTDVEKAFNKWLLIADKGYIRVLAATVIANMIEGDPFWLFIVAASGGTKTEPLRALSGIDGVYPISDLTEQTFISGDRQNKKASLLLRLPERVVLVLKDFTTVLSMHPDKRGSILSQLREIYDGHYKKDFGTGETKEWHGKLGFIAGVTSVIDKHHSVYQTLGERFLQYRPVQPDRRKVAKRAMENNGKEEHMRQELGEVLAGYIGGLKMPEQLPEVPEDVLDRIAGLAHLCATGRSGVVRDNYHTREIVLIPDAELPTRIAKQLRQFTTALMTMRGEYDESDYLLLWKIATDSIPKTRRRVLDVLYQKEGPTETASVATTIGYPTGTTRRILEELTGLEMAVRHSQQGERNADLWELTPDTRALLDEVKPQQEADDLSGKAAAGLF
jgi:DNA-binding MarR family transcriptional regulator